MATKRRSAEPDSQAAGAIDGRKAPWSLVRDRLLGQVRTLEATRSFRSAVQGTPLARFETPEALVTYLNDPAHHAHDKDAFYRALIATARAAMTPLWSGLLWLALWPGLDTAFHHCLPIYKGRADELSSELAAHLYRQVGRVDLVGGKLAATIIWNIERDVVRTVTKQRKFAKAAQQIEDFENRLPAKSPPMATDDDLAELRTELEPLVGRDTELIVRVLALGEKQCDAARALNLPYSTARKRLQRALRVINRRARANSCPISVRQLAFRQGRRAS